MGALPDRQRAVIASRPAVDNVRISLWRNIVQSGEEIWSALRDSLRGNASEAVWAAGLSTLHLVDYHDNELVIGAPNQIQLLRVQQRYLPFITEQAERLVGGPVQVSITVSDVTGAPAIEDAHESIEAAAPVLSSAPTVDQPTRLDPRMTFDSFVPG